MKFTDFASFVRQECQGVPDFMVERAVRDSAIEFCKRTGVYIPEAEEVLKKRTQRAESEVVTEV